MKNLHFKRSQTGQAMVEYIVICFALVVALLVPVPDDSKERNVIEILSDAVKAEYRAYKYANSVANLL